MAKAPPLSPPPPAFSKRTWTGPIYMPIPASAAALVEEMGLVIYVKLFRSRYAEDWPKEAEVWGARRAFPSFCYSLVEPEGEYGFTPLSEVTEISAEEFEGAMAGLRSGRWPGKGPT